MHLVDTSSRVALARFIMSNSINVSYLGKARLTMMSGNAIAGAMSAGISRPLRSGSPKISEFEIITKKDAGKTNY